MPNADLVKRCVIPLITGVLLTIGLHQNVLASEPCNPPNVLPRSACDMDSFHDAAPGQVPDGWTAFILSGSPTYAPDGDTLWGEPSLRIRIFDAAFKAGIYTQVPVQPGAGYRASISWGAPNTPDTFGRQLGIDPTGGTDPNSPNVIWGPMHWGPGRILNYPPPDVNIDVLARAAGDTVTVFFLVDHVANPGDNLIFIDAIGLYPDESAPMLTTSLPTPETPTSTPGTPTPSPVAPTSTPEPIGITSVDELYLPLLSDLAQAAAITSTVVPTDTPDVSPTGTPTATPAVEWSQPVRIAGDKQAGVSADFGSQPAVLENESSLLVAYSLSHGDDGQSGEDEAYLLRNLASSGWQHPMMLTDVDPGHSTGPPSVVMGADDRLHLLWTELTHGVGISAIYRVRASDLTWPQPEPIAAMADYRTENGNSTHTLVLLPDNSPSVVWLGYSGESDEVFWAVRAESGWSAPVMVSDGTDGAGSSAGVPIVALASDSAVHALWPETSGGARTALLASGALSWTVPTSAALDAACCYVMAGDPSGGVHLLMQTAAGLSYVYKSAETGWDESLQHPETVVEAPMPAVRGLSSLALDGVGTAHVVWIQGGQVWYAVRGTQSGWSAPVSLFERPETDGLYLHLIADQYGALHLLLHLNQEIWYATTSADLRSAPSDSG